LPSRATRSLTVFPARSFTVTRTSFAPFTRAVVVWNVPFRPSVAGCPFTRTSATPLMRSTAAPVTRTCPLGFVERSRNAPRAGAETLRSGGRVSCCLGGEAGGCAAPVLASVVPPPLSLWAPQPETARIRIGRTASRTRILLMDASPECSAQTAASIPAKRSRIVTRGGG
jgi:hypothetical protein